MTLPAQYFLQPLSWHQTRGRPETYQLRAIGGVIATLTLRGERGLVETSDANWRFEPSGIFRRRITINVDPSGSTVGVFRPEWLGAGGLLEIPPGIQLMARPVRFDMSYAISDAAGQSVIGYDLKGWASLRSPVAWGPAADQTTRFPWLLSFAWYLTVRHYHQKMAAAAVVIAG